MLVPLTAAQAISIGKLVESSVEASNVGDPPVSVEFHPHTDRVLVTIWNSTYEIDDDGSGFLFDDTAAA